VHRRRDVDRRGSSIDRARDRDPTATTATLRDDAPSDDARRRRTRDGASGEGSRAARARRRDEATRRRKPIGDGDGAEALTLASARR
jgi:hypothetical protein